MDLQQFCSEQGYSFEDIAEVTVLCDGCEEELEASLQGPNGILVRGLSYTAVETGSVSASRSVWGTGAQVLGKYGLEYHDSYVEDWDPVEIYDSGTFECYETEDDEYRCSSCDRSFQDLSDYRIIVHFTDGDSRFWPDGQDATDMGLGPEVLVPKKVEPADELEALRQEAERLGAA